MAISNLFNLLVFLIEFKESVLLRILGIDDPKSSKDLLYFMDTKEYESILANKDEPKEIDVLGDYIQSGQTNDLVDINDANAVIEPYTDDLYLKTDGDIPFFPTADGFIPDYVQIVSSKNNDPISLETFDIIFETVKNKVQYGIGIADIENVLFMIAFVRFVILCFKYNIKTSFLITGIGILSCYTWYRHFLSISTQYGEILYRTPYTFKFMSDLYDLLEYSKTYVFSFTTPYSLLWNAIKKAGFDYESYSYVDPISMLFSLAPKPLSDFTDYIYYTIYRDLGPQFIMYGKIFFKESTSLATYMFFVRINKKRCPYHIRWHWTCTLILGGLEFLYIPLMYRLSVWFMALEPAYDASYDPDLKIYTDIGLQTDYFMVRTVLFTCVFAHLAFIIYGMLQALCGQYFYVPFITENTELHIGKREKTIYSGGNTPWDERNNSVWNLLIPGYAWYNRQLKNKKSFKRIRKFIKKFKKFFS